MLLCAYIFCVYLYNNVGSWTSVNDTSKIYSTMAYAKDYSGIWYPKHCNPQSHVAVIIPYRDRAEHLNQLLVNLHSILRQQRLAYAVYVIEEVSTTANICYRIFVGFKKIQMLVVIIVVLTISS